MEPTIWYTQTRDGVSIAYYATGEGQPFVCLPPLNWSHLQLERQYPPLRAWFERLAKRRTLVRFDTRGQGLSERSVTDLSLEVLVHDMEDVVDHLELETFALCGVGANTMRAIAYAARHPERVTHLILFHPITKSGRGPAFGALLDVAEKDWKTYTESVAQASFGWLKGKLAHTFADFIRQSTDQETWLKMAKAAREFDVTSVLPEVSSPTLVVARPQLPGIDASQMSALASKMQDARVVFVAGTGSGIVGGDMDEELQAIDEFLGDGEGEREYEDASAQPEDAAQTRISSPPEAKTFASGRYVVKRLLGEGAQKSVYLVDDIELERECALSLIKADLLDPEDLGRLRREAQAMARLTHANIVTVHDIGEEGGRPYIVCEYVSGGELRDELAAAAGPLPLERALTVAIDICRALLFAHGEDIVHRDLKPENIWLTRDGSAKLGDFGIALSLGRTRLTMPGGITGTATYMAPEQVSGGDVDARSDLYAFGVLLYELVTGRPPFVGDDPNAIMYQHVNAEPESPVEHNATVPPSLDRLIMRLLAKPKAERPASADEVLTELEQAATELAGGLSTATVRHAPASSPIEQEIRFCTSADGTQLAYAVYGDHPGTPLVRVSLWSFTRELEWAAPEERAFTEGLAHGRRLITFDRRGVGASERDVDDVSLEAQVADLTAIVDDLGLERFDLLGYVDGGAVSIAYAVQHPERIARLALYATYPRGADGWSPEAAKSVLELIRTNWPLAVRMLADIILPIASPAMRRLERNSLREAVSPEVAEKFIESQAGYDISSLLPQVQAPTLAMHPPAGRNQINASRAVAALIPDARFIALEGESYQANCEEAARLLQQFLDEGRTQ